MINVNIPTNNVAENFVRFLGGRRAEGTLTREIEQSEETLTTALFWTDSKLASYVIGHLPRGGIYTSVNVCAIERSSFGYPAKTYRVISLSLNHARGAIASLHAIGSGLGICKYGHLSAKTDESQVITEIMNGLKGILPLDNQATKMASMKFSEVRLFVQQDNPNNVEIKLIDESGVVHTFEVTCLVGGVLKTAVLVLGTLSYYIVR